MASGLLCSGSSTAGAAAALWRASSACTGSAGTGGGAASPSGASSAFIERRWPSKIVGLAAPLVLAQDGADLGGCAASFSGPATSRSCMPSPLVPSLITMIGRSAASGALSRFQTARATARAGPRPNWRRRDRPRTRCAGSAAFGASGSRPLSSSAVRRAPLRGIGVARDRRFAAWPVRSALPAAGSGGAMIDLEATSGVAGDGALAASIGTTGPLVGRQIDRRLACRLRWPVGLSLTAAVLSAQPASSGAGFARARPGPARRRLPTEPAGGRLRRRRSVGGRWRPAPRDFACAIAPVTESSPCSSAVTREYSRSRSLLRVSMAEASRRASFWLSFASDWICCACRARSAAATWSRRHRAARPGWP